MPGTYRYVTETKEAGREFPAGREPEGRRTGEPAAATERGRRPPDGHRIITPTPANTLK